MRSFTCVLPFFHKVSKFTSSIIFVADHFDGVTLCLWLAEINEPIVHSQGDISMESHGGMILTGRTGKSLSQCHFVHHHKSYMDWTGRKPGPPRWENGD
jgi:hypothetical protein